MDKSTNPYIIIHTRLGIRNRVASRCGNHGPSAVASSATPSGNDFAYRSDGAWHWEWQKKPAEQEGRLQQQSGGGAGPALELGGGGGGGGRVFFTIKLSQDYTCTHEVSPFGVQRPANGRVAKEAVAVAVAAWYLLAAVETMEAMMTVEVEEAVEAVEDTGRRRRQRKRWRQRARWKRCVLIGGSIAIGLIGGIVADHFLTSMVQRQHGAYGGRRPRARRGAQAGGDGVYPDDGAAGDAGLDPEP
ncbi:Protein of unknown function [Gryllus bimaculatus]|nr:Protein of unknown function [Gryllus bimaculatus]